MTATMGAQRIEVDETRTVGRAVWSDVFIFQAPDRLQETTTRLDTTPHELIFGSVGIGTVNYAEDSVRLGVYQVSPTSTSAAFQSGALWFPLQLARLSTAVAGFGNVFTIRGHVIAPTNKVQDATFVGTIRIQDGLVTEGDLTITPGADDGTPMNKDYSYRLFNAAPPVTAPAPSNIEPAPASLGCPPATDSGGIAITICPNSAP